MDKLNYLNLDEILNNPELYEAHIKKEGDIITEREALKEHTALCQKYFMRIVEDKKLYDILAGFEQVCLADLSKEATQLFEDMLVNCVTFHDTGKCNPVFQNEKMKNKRVKNCGWFKQAGSRHSMISAQLYINYYRGKIRELSSKEERERLRVFLNLHAWLISKHHGGLDSMKEFADSIDRKEKYGHDVYKILKNVWPDICVQEFKIKPALPKAVMDKREVGEKDSENCMTLYAYARMVFSLLLASDYYAASEFFTGRELKDFGSLDNIEDYMDIYQNTKYSRQIEDYKQCCYKKQRDLTGVSDINVLRCELFLDAEAELLKNPEQSLYYLEAPTGSGKSNTAINLSFQLLKHDRRLRKIIYVYPFNTLVEQNFHILKTIFDNNKTILQGISVVNSLTPIKTGSWKDKDDEETDFQEALLNRQFLNYPFILTTHVNLFQTMFGDDKEALFAFYQLVNSVIVLDEIQSYKNILWSEIIHFLKTYAGLLNMRVIIMSATLPELELLADMPSAAVQLIKDREKYFSHPYFKNRVIPHYELLSAENQKEALYSHIKGNSQKNKRILVEFIRKESAREFYLELKKDDDILCDVEFMSGEDSILERDRIISKIRQKQNDKEGIILIATQVIEAGVDIDMEIGYKNISKLDSEEQFIGRINRSNKSRDAKGEVFFFMLDEPKRIYGEDVRVNPEFSIEQETYRTIFENKSFDAYYKDIMEVLQSNYKTDCFFKEAVGMWNFTETAKRMKLIETISRVQVFLCRRIPDKEGYIEGKEIWDAYKMLLQDGTMDYAEKKVKLSRITSRMNTFLYEIHPKSSLAYYHDRIGDIFCIENGDEYFEEGKLNKKKLEGRIGEFEGFI